MKSARLLNIGQSQAVQLPKECRFGGSSVYVQRLGRCVVLVPREDPWETMFDAATRFSDDFLELRDQGDQPDREGLH